MGSLSPTLTVPQQRGLIARLATHDLFPELSAHLRRWLYNPFGILLLAALASLVCGLFLHHQGVVLAGSIVVVMVLGVVWPFLSLRGLKSSISFDRPRVVEGESVQVLLSIQNHWPWAAWGLSVSRGFGLDELHHAVAGISVAPGRRSGLCRWDFVPPHRGVYPLQVPWLSTGFPFGLWEAHREISIEKPVVVWPKTFPVGPPPTNAQYESCDGNVSRNKVGSHGDVMGVRPYRRGDSPRRVHWGQSAKHDRLIVCELQATARPVIQLVLDIDPNAHVGVGEYSTREWAIRMVASFAKGWLQEGARVGLALATVELAPASGTGQLHKILDALAQIPNESHQSFHHLLACPTCHGQREGIQIVVTTDLGMKQLPANSSPNQRFVVLQSNGFVEDPSLSIVLEPAVRPWLTITDPEQIPQALRGGWEEARHGS